MTTPADSLPGDRLRPEEKEEVRKTLCRHMQAHSAQGSDMLFLPEELMVRLRADEFEEGKEQIEQFMFTHPVRSRFRLQFFPRLIPRFAGACLTVLLLGSGVAVAATDAVPGDLFYSVKIHVVEPAKELLQVTPVAKAQWASKQVQERLIEAEVLINHDALTSERWIELHHSFEQHLTKAEKQIERVAAEDVSTASDLSVELSESINTHRRALRDADAKKEKDVVQEALTRVNAASDSVARLRETIEKKMPPGLQKKMDEAIDTTILDDEQSSKQKNNNKESSASSISSESSASSESFVTFPDIE